MTRIGPAPGGADELPRALTRDVAAGSDIGAMAERDYAKICGEDCITNNTLAGTSMQATRR